QQLITKHIVVVILWLVLELIARFTPFWMHAVKFFFAHGGAQVKFTFNVTKTPRPNSYFRENRSGVPQQEEATGRIQVIPVSILYSLIFLGAYFNIRVFLHAIV
ncbi:hypothetical protein ACJX0J_038687, partial [Zea mays]